MNSDKNKFFSPEICPCCGKSIVDFYGVCEICGWENDTYQSAHPDYSGGANRMSLNEAKEANSQGKKVH